MVSDAPLEELLEILELARSGAPLVDSPVHGEQHWQCVARIGARLAAGTPGADVQFALLFGVLHDSRREGDGRDPEHGLRAAAFIDELHDGGRLTLDARALRRLRDAVTLHDAGRTTRDPIVGVCWDADRLCLPRIGIEPRAELLSTSAGRARPGWARALIFEPLQDWRQVLGTGGGDPVAQPRGL